MQSTGHDDTRRPPQGGAALSGYSDVGRAGVTAATTEAPAIAPPTGARLRVYLSSAISLAAAAVFAFALFGFTHPGPVPQVHYWWLMMAAPAITIVGLTIATAWQSAGLVAATLLLGFAAQLAFREPLWFQPVHIRLTTTLSFGMIIALSAQAATAALVILRATGATQLRDLGAKLGRLRLAALAAVLVAGSAGAMDMIASQKYGSLINQLAVGSSFLALNIVSFVALVMACPGEDARRIGDRVTRFISLPGSVTSAGVFDRRFPWCLALAVLVFGVFARFVVFENIPRIDEVVYLFHAEYFAQGRLVLPMPPSTAAFDIYMMNAQGGHWFSTSAPGWPFVLGIGVFFGAAWIVNPLLGAITVLLVHSLVATAEDRRFANLVAILLAVSPWFIWTSSTLMNHSLTLALVLGAWVLLIKARARPSAWLALGAGALMGLDFLTRPLEGLVIGALTGLWTLSFLKNPRHIGTVMLYAIGCVAVGGIVFPYNAYLTGDPLQTPLNAYFDHLWGPGSNRLGFASDIGAKPHWGALDPFPGHSPFEALIQAQQTFYSLNMELLGWAVGSVTFAAIFLLWGRRSGLTAAMSIVIVATVLAQALYWFSAFDYVGPRYWSMLLVPMLVLTAAGIVVCARRIENLFPATLAAYRLGAALAVVILCSLVVFSSWLGVNKYRGFRNYHTDYSVLAREQRFRHALVFVTMDDPIEYENAIWLNDFDRTSDRPVFARDLGEAVNRQVAASYPDRPVYFLQGRTHRSASNPRVTLRRGPISPAAFTTVAR
ncbi:MAG: glycosyltransferase family 39 protein [Novosphingobium sp.]